MQPNRFHHPYSLTFAAALLLASMCAGAKAGEIIDAVSPQARTTLDTVVRHAVEYDHCRRDSDLDEQSVNSYIELLSEALAELPQYAALDSDGRKVVLLNLLFELQQEAMAAPAPDCAMARVGGKRASLAGRPAGG
jgi:hypothetical protein